MAKVLQESSVLLEIDQLIKDKKFRKQLRKIICFAEPTRDIIENDVTIKKTNSSAKIHTTAQLSKSDSRDSTYSRLTSFFGLGSSQSSQDTFFDVGNKKTETKNAFLVEEDEDGERVENLSTLRRTNAVDEVDIPSNVPNIIVHAAENVSENVM